MLLMTLQFVPDADGPHALVRRYLDALPSGSYLVVSHPASDVSDVANQATARYNGLVATGMTRRNRAEFEAFFDGLELVEPGVVHLSAGAPAPTTRSGWPVARLLRGRPQTLTARRAAPR